MSPGSGVRPSTSSSSLGKLFRRSDKSQDDGSASKASSEVNPQSGQRPDWVTPSETSSTPFLSDKNIEAIKDEIAGILDPEHSPEDTVSDRLDAVNARIMGWETDSTNPKLAATARYYLAAQQTSRTLFYGSNALQPVRGRSDVKSVPLHKTTHGILQLAASAASHVPGVSAVLKLVDEAVSAYSKTNDFDDIHKAVSRVLKQEQIEPFSESLALGEALMKMGTLGTIADRTRNTAEPKGKLNRRPAERKKEEVKEENLAAKDTANAIKALAFGDPKAKKISKEHARRLREMTTEAKVKETLRHFCNVKNIKFNERMVACRPSHDEQLKMHDQQLKAHDEELGTLRRSISIGRFNQNPVEEAVPDPASAGGYSREEKKTAKEDVLKREAEKNKAKADYDRLHDKAHKIPDNWRHRRDKNAAEAEAKKAEKIYGKAQRAVDRAKAKPAYQAGLKDDSSSDDAANDPTYPRTTAQAHQLSWENPAFPDYYGADDNAPPLAATVGQQSQREHASQPSNYGQAYTYPIPSHPAPSATQQTWGGLNVAVSLRAGGYGTSAQPIALANQRLGRDTSRPGPSNQAGIPAGMSTGRPLERSPWQAAPAPALRDNIVEYEPESDEELAPASSISRRRNDAAQPSGSGSATAASTRPDNDKAARVLSGVEELCIRGDTLYNYGHREDAIEAFNDVITFHGEGTEPELREIVAKARLRKNFMLHGHGEEAIETFSVSTPAPSAGRRNRRNEDVAATARALSEAKALCIKGDTLREYSHQEDAIEAFNEVITRYRKETGSTLRVQVAKAHLSKAKTFDHFSRGEKAIETYNEVITCYGKATEPELREIVAEARLSIGFTHQAAGDKKKAIEVLDEVFTHYGKVPELNLRVKAAKALYRKAGLLTGTTFRDGNFFVLRDCREAIKAFNDVVTHYGNSTEPELQTIVAQALNRKGSTQNHTEHRKEAIEAHNEVITRYGKVTMRDAYDVYMEVQYAREYLEELKESL